MRTTVKKSLPRVVRQLLRPARKLPLMRNDLANSNVI
jgi:hypothetical protein